LVSRTTSLLLYDRLYRPYLTLVVRRQVRSITTAVLEPPGSSTIFGSSVRSAKNLFVMCAAYYLVYLPVLVRMLLKAQGVQFPDAANFVITWTNISAAALNGFLYIVLHSSVRREVRRYLPRCRRPVVCSAAQSQPAAGGGTQRRLASADTDASAPVAIGLPSTCDRLPTGDI